MRKTYSYPLLFRIAVKTPSFATVLVSCVFLFFSIVSQGQCGTCTLTEANLVGAPNSYTIPAGQTLCITSNFCMGSSSNYPGPTCANVNISQLTINGTLKICTSETFKYSGTIVGSGKIEIMSGARFSFNGSYDCSLGLTMTAVDPTIASGTSTASGFSACNTSACEPHFSNGYAPFGIVAAGLGYSINGGCSVKGYPDNSQLLPAVLSNWTAGWQGDNIVLNWSLADQSEQGFVAEYSSDGLQWHPASNLINAGGDNSPQRYSFTVSGPFAETNFFRLKMINNSGGYSYTTILEVAGPNKVAAGILVIPNPVLSSFTIHNKSNVAIAGIRLADNTGQSIRQLPANSSSYSMDKLAPGSYFLLLSMADGSTLVKKLTKL